MLGGPLVLVLMLVALLPPPEASPNLSVPFELNFGHAPQIVNESDHTESMNYKRYGNSYTTRMGMLMLLAKVRF